MAGQECIVGLHQHVHDGVADANHIQGLGGGCHGGWEEL